MLSKALKSPPEVLTCRFRWWFPSHPSFIVRGSPRGEKHQDDDDDDDEEEDDDDDADDDDDVDAEDAEDDDDEK